ncbi:MAG: allantoinase AllB [Nitrososphaerota archaeon]
MAENLGGNLLVKNGRVVTSEGLFNMDILIIDGVIEAIGRDLKQSYVEVLDVSGMLVFPGVVDEHVHMREPGLTYKEDFITGTMAAAAGGVTTVLDMPNNIPPVDSLEKLKEKRRIVESKAYVDFGLYGVLHDSNIDDLEEMWYGGAVGFKVFLGPTTGDIPPPSDKILLEALEKSGTHGFTLAFHAENYGLVEYYTRKIKMLGRNDPEVYSDSRPNVCEEEAVSRIVIYTRKTNGKALIVHTSTSEAVSIIREAKSRGVKIYCETCPQYLLLNREAYSRHGSLVKINPPLRDRFDQESLWRGLRENMVDTVASDHAPHTIEEKSKNIWEAAAGFIGVETLFPLMLDSALRGLIPLEKIPEILSEKPARIFNLYPKKGSISVGADGDLVIVDPNHHYTIKQEELHSKHKITPFNGIDVRGWIKHVVLRGVEIVRDRKVVCRKPLGKFVKPVV